MSIKNKLESPVALASIESNESKITIEFPNGVSLSFGLADRRLCGLGECAYLGKPLRSSSEYIFPEIATPDGREVDFYEYLSCEEREGSVVIKTRPWFRVAHRMEWAEHGLHQRINTGSWSRGPVAAEGGVLEWHIKPESDCFEGKSFAGFSYAFHYDCPGYGIYQIEDKASWELGGNAVGNTFIMRGGTAHPIVTFAEDTAYDSSWTLPGVANPYVFQHFPLYAGMQGFTFQSDSESILLTSHERPSHVRSLFKRNAEDEKLLHFNQFCFDLAAKVSTPARRILVAENEAETKVQLFNTYLGIRDELHQRIHRYYNIKLDLHRPEAKIETWEIANVEQFPDIWDQVHAWGLTRAFLLPFWKSAETELVPKLHGSEASKKVHGFMGNMCCPFNLEIADVYGGFEGFRKAMEHAVKHEIEAYMWFGSHFSASTALVDEIPDLFARDQCGQNHRNNYGHVLCAVNQNSKQYQEYLIGTFRKLKEAGLSGIFRDSHFNMAADTLNYLQNDYESTTGKCLTIDKIGGMPEENRPSDDYVRSMHDTEAHIQSRFQNELEMLYFVESKGCMGTPVCGLRYKNAIGNEFIYSNFGACSVDWSEAVKSTGWTHEYAYFRGIAVRCSPPVDIELNEFPKPEAFPDWWNPETFPPLLKAFNEVEPHMESFRLLEDDNGVIWRDRSSVTLFAYQDFEAELPADAVIKDVMAGSALSREGKRYQFKKMGIYQVTSDSFDGYELAVDSSPSLTVV